MLDPKDFGLLGMVTAFTGVLSLFRDFGLSAAAIQRVTVTEEQSSTLFWINLLFGFILAIITIVSAPIVASFYHEPRLFWVTCVVATGFVFNAAGIQHSALMQRQMRFTTLAWIEVASLVASTAVAIGVAKAGYGYWALVAMTISLPLAGSVALWLTSGWRPGMPRRRIGISSMMRFGSILTLNGLVLYIATNFEKVLLGRFWGAEALGIYGRAYQLIRIPTDNLNTAVGDVAFSALSRIKDDPTRLRRYFLKGYSLVVAVALPITIACGLFADDMVVVLLGTKWREAAAIFRLLAPMMLMFAILNPLGWLLNALGLVERGLKIAFVLAPLMIASYVVGLPYGPKGVAAAYSVVMMLWLIPGIAWAVHGTVVSFWDVLREAGRPLASILPGAALAIGLRFVHFDHIASPLVRLIIENAVLFSTYIAMLIFAVGQKAFYLDVLRGLRRSSAASDEQDLLSVV
jgi:PST family polysaccharide transporter